MDEPSNWIVFTQRLGYYPEGWVKHLSSIHYKQHEAYIM